MTKRSTPATLAERAVFAGLLVVLALAPMPFGGDRPWAWSLLAVSTGVLLLGWGLLAARSPSYQAASIRPLLPAVGLFLAVIAWAAVQTSGLVPPEWRHPLWHAAEGALGAPVAAAVTLDQHRTWTALMRLMCYGAVFLLAFQLCMATDRSARLIRLLVGMTLVYACYGLITRSPGGGEAWFAGLAASGDVSGTFGDRDAFAAYAGLGLLCALALLFRPTMRSGDLTASWRFTLRALADYFFARSWTLLLSAAVLSGVLMTTDSRGGLAGALLAAGAYLAFMTWVRRHRVVAVTALGVMAVAAASLYVIEVADEGGRAAGADVAQGAMRASNLVPAAMLGTGYGTVRDHAEFRHGAAEAPSGARYNAYVATALEIGIPAAVALALSVGWIVLLCFSSVLRHRRAAFLPCLGVAATVLAGALGAVDHGLVPAVAATYAAIMGAAVAQAFRLELPGHRNAERRAG